jgi:hypothetical protein
MHQPIFHLNNSFAHTSRAHPATPLISLGDAQLFNLFTPKER